MGPAPFPRMRSGGRFLEKPRIYGGNWYWLGFGALGAAALLIAVMAFVSLRSLDRAKDTVLRDYARYLVHAQTAHLLIEKQVNRSRGYFLTGDSLYLNRWTRSRTELHRIFDTLVQHAPGQAERFMMLDLINLEQRHESALRSLVEEHPILPRRPELLEAFRAGLQPLRDSLDWVSASFVEHGMSRLAEAEAEAGRTAWIAMAAVGVTTVFSLLLSLLLAKQVTRRLADSQITLQRSQARLDAVVSSAMDAIITTDESQRIVLFNRAAERVFRLPVEQALGKHLLRFIPQRHRKSAASQFEVFGGAGSRINSTGLFGKLSGLRADGEEFPLEAAISQTEVGGERLHTLILRDVTERHRAEEALKESEAKLRQSQKMEAIGQLAGGVAHDFNNLLTAINGYCELTLSLVDRDGPAYENLQEIRKAGGRAATLTNQLLAYSRKQVVAPRVLNLNQVVGNISNMLQRLIGDNISLFTQLEPELDLVKVDGGQVEQALVNMILNARDSMPKGGRIEIRTRNVVLGSDAKSMVLEADPGRYVVIEVADKGSGMPEELQAHIFEPFFTTKGIGKGTGLGLSSVYGIVKQASGALKVESAEGQGSTFSIFFPALDAEARPRAEDEAALGAAHRGSGETLLLAEDEPAVRHFTRKTLESHGYKVMDAKDGQEALKKFQENGSPVKLLVTDMVMPGMNGRELAGKIRESRPGLRVLYMSGYMEEALDIAGLQAKGDLYLAKPFSPEQLLQCVFEILRGKVAAR